MYMPPGRKRRLPTLEREGAAGQTAADHPHGRRRSVIMRGVFERLASVALKQHRSSSLAGDGTHDGAHSGVGPHKVQGVEAGLAQAEGKGAEGAMDEDGAHIAREHGPHPASGRPDDESNSQRLTGAAQLSPSSQAPSGQELMSGPVVERCAAECPSPPATAPAGGGDMDTRAAVGGEEERVLTSVSARQVEAKQTASPACSPPLGLSLGSPPLSLALPLSLTCDSVPLPVAPTQGLPQNLEGPGEEEVEEGAIQRVPTSDLVGSDSGLQQVRSLLQAELQAAPPGSYSAVRLELALEKLGEASQLYVAPGREEGTGAMAHLDTQLAWIMERMVDKAVSGPAGLPRGARVVGMADEVMLTIAQFVQAQSAAGEAVDR